MTNIESLAPEILLHICELVEDRMDLLRLALVARRFRDPAQRAFYTDLNLQIPRSQLVESTSQSLCPAEGVHRAAMGWLASEARTRYAVRSVKMEGGPLVGEILAACGSESLDTLIMWKNGPESDSAVPLSVLQAPALANLKYLDVNLGVFQNPPHSFPFRPSFHLDTLAVREGGPRTGQIDSIFLRGVAQRSIKALKIHSYYPDGPYSEEDGVGALHHLAPLVGGTLRHLSLNISHIHPIHLSLFDQFTELQILTIANWQKWARGRIWPAASVRDVVAALPSSTLSHFTVEGFPQIGVGFNLVGLMEYPVLLDLVNEPNMANLEAITLRGKGGARTATRPPIDVQRYADAGALGGKLAKLCQTRGITMNGWTLPVDP